MGKVAIFFTFFVFVIFTSLIENLTNFTIQNEILPVLRFHHFL